ncbi:MAG: cation diffusion facilitator CzcD-associated flavoprotein CzcO [Gammaproteobacteria bacterium]|jgi:cation diffusion facilitator CzcD-associated flavoprotein CzcO
MPNPTTQNQPEDIADLDALIIGAGFSGMYQLLCLRDRLGLSALVLEAGEGVGGTWYWNRYPGARCDTESHCYSYYFAKEALQDWEWSERYPEQPEIMRYMNHVADRFDLKRDIRFGKRVTTAHYDEGAKRWLVATETGERFRVTYLITAVGCLSTANIPDIPGLDSFAGDWYHTGHWPHEGVDFSGKRVGQIGTGSTGIQAAPVIAAAAEHLTVFQRTANYSVPARNVPLTDEFKRYVRENFDLLREQMHTTPNGHSFSISERLVFDVSESEREALYEAAWERGGLQFRAAFEDIMTSKAANDTAAQFIRKKIMATVNDSATAQVLADIDHPYAAKRPPIDSHYFEIFNRDNVSLVDLRAAPIERITPNTIVTGDGEYELDTIVFATGFDAMTGPLLAMDIRGRDATALRDVWSAGPRTYLGLQVAGFPNLFTVTGPGSPSVLCNMPVAIEQHVEWITDCIADMQKQGIETIETTPEAVDEWVEEVNRAANATVLSLAKHSWYFGANVPGKPRVFMPYAGGMKRYRDHCAGIAARGYEGFVRS